MRLHPIIAVFCLMTVTCVSASTDTKKCPTCVSSETLRRRIIEEAPEVAQLSGIDKAIALLQWASTTGDYSPDPGLTPASFETWSAQKMVYDFFDHDLGGISCGGYAVFFRKILNLFGIDAFEVNYGIPNSYVTHVTVIVPDRGEFYVLDPSFAVTFTRGNENLSVDRAIKLIMSGRSDLIHPREHLQRGRDILVRSRREISSFPEICERLSTTPAGLTKCSTTSYSYFSAFQRGSSAEWRKFNVQLDNAGLFRLMREGFFSVNRSIDPRSRTKFIARMKNLGIPFHAS